MDLAKYGKVCQILDPRTGSTIQLRICFSLNFFKPLSSVEILKLFPRLSPRKEHLATVTF